ncbi:MAG: cysteine desulfurase family protein [Candidatus Muiribacteriota bacterium]
MRRVYLDNNATTPLLPEVKQEVIEFLDIYGNASSLHKFGKESRLRIEKVREKISEYIGAKKNEIYFTSGASEANNLVLKGVSSCGKTCCPGKESNPHIITTVVEHPSVLNTCKCLEGLGVEVTYLKVDSDGRISLEELEKSIKTNTSLISVMFANNEIGTIQPIREIGLIAKKHNIKFHTDAVQVFAKENINVDDLNIDFLTFSGHKFNALKGVGGLYIRSKNHVCPLIHGGHQEGMLRAGTENTIGIISMGKALEYYMEHPETEDKILKMRNDLENYILQNISDTKLNGHKEYRLKNTVNISFRFIEGESILLMLDHLGIAVSTGSACSSDSLEPSHVLKEIGLDDDMAHSSVRISLGPLTTQEEIDYVKNNIKNVIDRLRSLSPLYNEA